MKGLFDLHEYKYLVDEQLKIDCQEQSNHDLFCMNTLIDKTIKNKCALPQPKKTISWT